MQEREGERERERVRVREEGKREGQAESERESGSQSERDAISKYVSALPANTHPSQLPVEHTTLSCASVCVCVCVASSTQKLAKEAEKQRGHYAQLVQHFDGWK